MKSRMQQHVITAGEKAMSDIQLTRFEEAHRCSYKTALTEIRNGRKETHWMWFIFPQIHGLGKSPTSQYYAIQNLDEARAFLNDSYLGGNLLEITNALLLLDEDNPTAIFGKPDDKKLRSSMTLFALVSEDDSVFRQVLNKYFEGKPDKRTLGILGIKGSAYGIV